MFHILVVEDDQALNKLICRVLNKNGYETASATDGEEALALLDQMYIDLIITDLMMPNMDGYDLTKALRDSGYQLPILVVTARDTFPDKAKGFKLGIDDYMVKPIDVNELLLRVEALLRRAKIIYEKKLEFDHVCLDYINLNVTIDDNSQILPQKEFQLLYKLLSFPNHTFTRQQIMDELWGYDSETDIRTVDVHINRLRDRFRDIPYFQIQTVRGLGYKGDDQPKKMKNSFYSIWAKVVVCCFWMMIFSFLIVGLTIHLMNQLNVWNLLPLPLTGLHFIFVLAIITTILGVFISMFIFKHALNPITQLSRSMQQVAEGNYNVKLDADPHKGEIHDLLTNFNHMVQELNSTETLHSDFISSVSHEFKTPLATISGYATLLQDDTLSAEERNEYINIIIRTTRELSHMTGNILSLSRLENQTIITDQESFHVDEQIRQCILLRETIWSEKNLVIDPDLGFYHLERQPGTDFAYLE